MLFLPTSSQVGASKAPPRLRKLAGTAALLLACGFGSSVAMAQDAYRLIVPFPPGGGTDTMARAVAQTLSQTLNQTVVVDNRAGAGGTIGATALMQADPNGRTLFLSSNSVFTINPAIRSDSPYDPRTDFEGLAIIGTAPLCLLTRSDAPWPDLKSLISAAKAEPGKLSFASFGSGSVAHFAGELFADQAGLDLLHVPYKGSAPAMHDLLGGRVDFSFDTVTAALPHVAANRLKCLGVTSGERFAAMADTPTLAEAGVPGYHFTTWVGIVTRSGTPPQALTPLRTALQKSLQEPELIARLEAIGLDVASANDLRFEDLLKEEIPRYQEVAAKADIRID